MIKMSKTMSDRMAIVETKIDYLTVGQEDIIRKLDTFINTANSKYATKEEMKEVKSKLTTNSSRLWDIAWKVAYVLGVLAVGYVGLKGGL